MAFAVLLAGMTSSCKEYEEESEFANWQKRNQNYVDSIASLAASGTDGWSRMLAYNLNDSVEALAPNNNHFVYVQKIEQGTGDYSPLFCDSIRVHYMGRLIPTASYPQGYVFGKSYSTYTLNEATDVPVIMPVDKNVVGFATATLHMVVGDRWKIVIPYYLGYGTTVPKDIPDIPGYSALTFDVKLARVFRYGIDVGGDWH